MDDQYFVIYVDENADAFVEKLDEATLLERLNAGEYPTPMFPAPSGWARIPDIPGEVMSEWNPITIIIKGRQVAPLPIETVTKFKLP